MKVLIVITIMSICTVISIVHIKQIRNHTRALKQCMMLIENIRIYIEYNGLSIDEIFNIVCNSNNFDLLLFLKEIKKGINGEYYEILNSVFSDNNLITNFDNEDVENLQGFFSMLGRSDINGQLLNCELYKNLFEKKYMQLESNQTSKCKSAATFVFGVGLLFSIIVI